MPELNWNDLRVILAIARTGTRAAAARMLRVDETTVARRLAAAEAALTASLFHRVGGTLRPSDAGERAVRDAEHVERTVGTLQASLGDAATDAVGTVRLTSVPILVNHILVPAVPSLAARHPGVHLELLAEPRGLSLSKREADIALRLARPGPGAGAAVLARRIGLLHYGIYASADDSPEAAAALPWITYEDSMSALSPARWLAARVGADRPALAVNDAEAILHATARGIERSILPSAVADRDPALRRLDDSHLPAIPPRELWLLTHPDQGRLGRVAAVVGWLEQTLRAVGIAA